MNRFQRAVYYTLGKTIRAYQRLFLDLQVWGKERIKPGPKIYVSNHITSSDVFWLPPLLPEPISMVIGPAYKSKIFGALWDYLDMINAMPEHRQTVVDQGVKRLQAGRSVYVFPEGDCFDQFQLGSFYPGFARMSLRAGVPIIPIGIVTPKHRIHDLRWFQIKVEGRAYRTLLVLRGTYLVNIGAPIMPDFQQHLPEKERIHALVQQVRDQVSTLVNEVRRNNFWLS